jgi:hypothetical protein
MCLPGCPLPVTIDGRADRSHTRVRPYEAGHVPGPDLKLGLPFRQRT